MIFSFEGTPQKSGDYGEEVTPVPISNTVVKLLSADDTWWETAWESRTLPVFLMPKKLRLIPKLSFYIVAFILREGYYYNVADNRCKKKDKSSRKTDKEARKWIIKN